MPGSSLDDFMAINDQLGALAAAGVPVELGLGKPPAEAAAALERVNAVIARRVSQGASLEEALQADDQPLPATYRCLMQISLRSGDVSSALQGLSHLAQTADTSQNVVRSALLYPLVVCGLAYVGLVGLCLYFVPVLATSYRELEVEEGFGLQIMQALAESLPYWVAIPPVVLILIVWRMRTSQPRVAAAGRTSGLWSQLSGVSRTIQLERFANFADNLAMLVEAGTPLHQGLTLAACGSGDADLAAAAKELSPALQRGSMPGDDAPAAQRFPPFLRWALWRSDATIGQARALRMAAAVYRDSARLRTRRLGITAPLVACVVLGGGVTLLYCLAMFFPVAELLRGLAY